MAPQLITPTPLGRRVNLRSIDWEMIDAGPVPGRYTEEEYLALDGVNRRMEFTAGVLEVLTLPTYLHQTLILLLCMKLHALRIDGRPGRAMFAGFKIRVRADKWREPDVLYLRPENEHLHDNRWWTHVDFAIEVVGPDDPKRDYVVKRQDYLEAKIREYWILDALKRQLLVLVLDPGAAEYREAGTFAPGDVVRSATLPGFEVDFAKLLAEAEGPPKA